MISFFTDFWRQLFTYREYLKQSVMRDLRNKYKRSSLGYVWTMLHPLGMMLIMTFVLAHLVKVPMKDYAVFFLSGLLVWNYFNSTAMMSLNNIRANSRLFSQVAVPRYIFIVSLTLSNMFNLLVAIIPLLVVMLVVGRSIPWTVILLPVVLLPIYILTIGVSLIFAVSNVFFEDTLHLSEVLMQALYFLTPILYVPSMLPAEVASTLKFNPLFYQVDFFRGLFFDGVYPDPFLFVVNLGVSLFVLAFGLWIFHRTQDKFLYFI